MACSHRLSVIWSKEDFRRAKRVISSWGGFWLGWWASRSSPDCCTTIFPHTLSTATIPTRTTRTLTVKARARAIAVRTTSHVSRMGRSAMRKIRKTHRSCREMPSMTIAKDKKQYPGRYRPDLSRLRRLPQADARLSKAGYDQAYLPWSAAERHHAMKTVLAMVLAIPAAKRASRPSLEALPELTEAWPDIRSGPPDVPTAFAIRSDPSPTVLLWAAWTRSPVRRR